MPLYGLDVSEHNNGLNLHTAQQEGYDFAIIRICDGTYKDPIFNSHLKDAETAGLITSGYWYLRAPTDTTTLEIHLTAQDGRYFGPEHTSTGITTIENTGQLPLWPTIHWKSLTARITEDKNGPIILPPALGATGLIYHTSPDTGGLITDTHGYPNHNAWATLRGIAWTRPIMPGDATTIDCHKCHIHWRNQYLQPWAQTGGIVSNARTSNNSNGRTWATASGRPHAIRLFD